MLDRTALRVEGERGLPVGVIDAGLDGLLVVWVGDLVAVVEHQRLPVGQAQHHGGAAWLAATDGGHAGAGRQRQVHALEFVTTLRIEEQHAALVGNTHAHQVLFFEGDHQRLAGVLLQPGRGQRLLAGQLGTLEQGQHHVGEVEEDQRDRSEHGQAADQHVPAGQAVLEGAQAPLALQLGRIEINPHRRGILGHGGVGQIIHAHTLTVPYDRNMTVP